MRDNPRPVSNYYEYESVQAMMSHAQDNSHTTSLPRRPHPHQFNHHNNNVHSTARASHHHNTHPSHSIASNMANNNNNIQQQGINKSEYSPSILLGC